MESDRLAFRCVVRTWAIVRPKRLVSTSRCSSRTAQEAAAIAIDSATKLETALELIEECQLVHTLDEATSSGREWTSGLSPLHSGFRVTNTFCWAVW